MSAARHAVSRDNASRNVLTIQTVQIAPFRTLMTALKDILLETNIVFTAEGMSIINMDKSQTILVHMMLEADKFEFYECRQHKIIIGVNLHHLFKLINSIDADDTLSIYIEEDDYADGIVSHLSLKFENGAIRQCKTQKLKTIDPECEELPIPEVAFSSVLNMPTADFQKIIRDLSALSDYITVQSVGSEHRGELICSCNGDFASAVIRRSETDTAMKFTSNQSANKLYHGKFLLKNLGYVIKCTNMCSHVEICLENDRPMVIKYSVASLGHIRFAVASSQDEA